MSAQDLHSRLDKVRHTGSGRSQAICPAHSDKRASLSIRELDDGRTLLHCFAGCSVEEILGAVGLTFDALFPEKPPRIEGHRGERRPFLPADAFKNLVHEVTVAFLIACDMRKDKSVSGDDYERLQVVMDRLNDIGSHAYGQR